MLQPVGMIIQRTDTFIDEESVNGGTFPHRGQGSQLALHQAECTCMSMGRNYFVLSVILRLHSCKIAHRLYRTCLL